MKYKKLKGVYLLDDKESYHLAIEGLVLKEFKTKPDKEGKTYEVALILSKGNYLLLWGWFDKKHVRFRRMTYNSKVTALKKFSNFKNHYKIL